MATPTEDQQRRDRIIAHMNRDHKPQLALYLRHFASLSPSAASSPELIDVSFDRMLIRAGGSGSAGTSYSVPFLPPLSAWDDIRPRVVTMDAIAREALGASDVVLAKFAPPRGLDWVLFGGVLFYFCCAATLPLVKPGTAIWDFLKVVYPGGPEWYRWLVKTLFVPTVGIHLVECVLLDMYKMKKHGVQRWSKVWWMWELSCFCEGFTSFLRINSIVAEKRAEKAAKSH